ncbi:hypothetical protein BDZ91DRAFT_744233 [Kalaharituber pfeilii]|nr:hypothetical protein BDZ91DRAFT_744233 [Kalaharituber pfeilii]
MTAFQHPDGLRINSGPAGLCTIVFIEFKAVLDTHIAEYRKNAIAQVIAEADACCLRNERNNLDNPIYAILSHGIDFHFFRFTPRSAKTSSAEPPLLTIAMGYHMSLPTAVLATQPPARTYFHLLNVSCTDPSRFLSQLCLLCETIFWVFLAGYTASLEAYLTRSRIEEKDNVERWTTALDKAKNAIHFPFTQEFPGSSTFMSDFPFISYITKYRHSP